MSKILIALICFTLIFFLCGCPFNGPDPQYLLEMYVSLSIYGTFPAEYPGNTMDDLLENYGSKRVFFQVEGVDSLINNTTINKVMFSDFSLTGGDSADATLYAGVKIDMSENTMYLAGRYRISMYIDLDGTGSLNSGDIVFGSYSILADTDGDSDTESINISEEEWGTGIQYNQADYTLMVDDPLSGDEGLSWVITAVHEGELAVYP